MRDRLARAFPFLALAFAVACLALAATSPTRPARAGNGDANPPAQVTDGGYAPDRGNFQALRSTVAAIDTPTRAIVLATPAFQVQGRQTFYLGTRFTNSGATVSLRLAYVWRHPSASSDTDVSTRSFSWKTATWSPPPAWLNQSYSVASNVIKDWGQVTTVTAGTVQHEGSYYVPNGGPLLLDTERADTIRVIVTTAPSAGSCDFWCGS